MIEGKKILIISPEGWGANFVSKHLYANYLSKDNEVYFLNPPSGSNKYPGKKFFCESKEISKKLFCVDYINLCPALNKLPKVIQASIYKKQARRIQEHLRIQKFDIIWSFDPYRFWNLSNFEAEKYIYHTVDVHFRKCFEEEITESADLVLLSSELLRKKLTAHNKNIQFIGHGADLDSFAKTSNDQSVKINIQGKVKAGLVGNFNSNVDYNLIEKIIIENPDVDFHFVGPYKNDNLGGNNDSIKKCIDKLSQYKNAKFVGSVPSNEIILWLKKFDINLVLYKEERRDIIINPHKMMAYFYSGNITISSWFNEYKDMDSELLIMTEKNHEISEMIKKVSQNIELYNQKDSKLKRIEFAKSNGYSDKISRIGKWLY